MKIFKQIVFFRNDNAFQIYDIFLFVLSPILAFYIRGDDAAFSYKYHNYIPIPYLYSFASLLTGVVCSLFFGINKTLYRHFNAQDVLRVLWVCLSSVALAVYFLFSIKVLNFLPRSVPIVQCLLLIVGLCLYRNIMRIFFETSSKTFKKSMEFNREYLKRVIIVGLDEFSLNTSKLLRAQRPQSHEVIAILSSSTIVKPIRVGNYTIARSYEDLGRTIAEYLVHGISVTEVWLSDNSVIKEKNLELEELCASICDYYGVQFKLISEALNISVARYHDYASVDLDTIEASIPKYIYFKRFYDLLFSILLLLLLSPVFIFLSLIVLFDVGSPIIFWQERIGLNHSKFMIYKFRSLHDPIDQNGEIIPDQLRLSGIGKFIRYTRLDELPQLLNILVGNMSFIGPRPLLMRDQPSDINLRLSIRPGITGWGQVNGNNLLHPEERNFLDCWYIYNCNLYLDILIIAKTLYTALFGVERNEHNLALAKNWYLQKHAESIVSVKKHKI